MSRKKPWCKAPGDAACRCREGECWADRNREYIQTVNMLINYGLTGAEVAEDMKGKELK